MSLITITLVSYVIFTGGVFLFQRSLLYPASQNVPNPAAYGVPGIEEVQTETADGLRLTHWYRPPREPGAAVVVVFHGNAGNLGDRVPKLVEILRAGYGMLLMGYRGYGGNQGRPSEEALTGDARGLLDWLAGQGVPPERTVLYGESLGSGIAVKLAAEREVAGVILEAPYTSIAELAQLHYWYLPAKWLILDRWNSLDIVAGLRAPLLVVHGGRDRTVPPRYSRRLFEAAPEPKEYFLFDQASHNDLYDFPQVPARVIDFLRRQAPAPG